MLAFMFISVFLTFVFSPRFFPLQKIWYLVSLIVAILIVLVCTALLHRAQAHLYYSFVLKLDEKLKELGFETTVYLKPLVEFPRGKHVKAKMFRQGNYFLSLAVLNEVFVEGENKRFILE